MKKLDLEWLLKVRVIVARHGEMDVARWWNTDGQLGTYGAKIMSRGFPRTHHFAQARSVFAVAAHRCSQVFDPPASATFWHLSDAIEDEFDARWEQWLDGAGDWRPFFEEVAVLENPSLVAKLEHFGLASDPETTEALGLRRSNEGRAVRVPGEFSRDQRTVALLALSFEHSGVGDLAVPYIPRANT